MASALIVGKKAPAFSGITDEGKTVSLSQLKGKTVVLYFYPKDDTPGCTAEACDFSANIKTFTKSDAVIIGVSKDSVKSHQKFKTKYKLAFPLLSDESGEICEAYGVWVEKSMYGKKYMGIERSTFVIDPQGVLKAVFRKVKVNGHTAEVLGALAGGALIVQEKTSKKSVQKSAKKVTSKKIVTKKTTKKTKQKSPARPGASKLR